jgi:hypothetical protein
MQLVQVEAQQLTQIKEAARAVILHLLVLQLPMVAMVVEITAQAQALHIFRQAMEAMVLEEMVALVV